MAETLKGWQRPSVGDTTRSELRTLPLSSIQQTSCVQVGHHVSDVVKELVENAIDAGANAIHVILENGGYSLIKVIDNGVGIRCEAMPRMCRFHTTSKLPDGCEWRRVQTLGFHGSALAHISCLGTVTITSRMRSESRGTTATFAFNVLLRQAPTDMEVPGTCVEVKDFLFSHPEIRELRPNPDTEALKATNLVAKYAAYYNSLAFTVKTNGRDRLSTPGNITFMAALKMINSVEHQMNSFVQVTTDSPGSMKAECYLSNPKITCPNPIRGIFLGEIGRAHV
jgi:DNA mismatch repair protein MLH1